MIKITDPNDNSRAANQPIAFLEFAFRPLFLFAAIFSMISLLVWNGILTGNLNIRLFGGSLWWHMHEMLFAFATTVIVGFLLTAVQNWSGVRSLHGKGLGALVILWLLARIAFFFPDQLPHTLIITLDALFLPLSALALAIPIVKTKLWRNLMFIPILLIMAITNLITHYSAITNNPILMGQAATFMVLLITLVMCIMGGRVFPMFTANGTKTPRVDTLPLLEKLSLISILITIFVAALATSTLFDVPTLLVAVLFITTSVIHAIRVFRWKFSVTLSTPLVLSLHISYWCIVIGLLMFGLSQITYLVSHSQAIHTLTIGAMATMILSMISRVSLGHTGRIIAVGKTMSIAFIAIILAFVVRVFGLYFIANYSHVLSLTVALWIVGFGCFVVIYTPILLRPKAR